jgi:hypothetical protein
MFHGITEPEQEGQIGAVFSEPFIEPEGIGFAPLVIHTGDLTIVGQQTVAASVLTWNAEIHNIDGNGFQSGTPRFLLIAVRTLYQSFPGFPTTKSVTYSHLLCFDYRR